ncbi:hypothetical protein [Gordonia sp. SND2]|uniref:hypothetical protein n=1 Tax=Gordonia sp. SND2 TaxID=3388659 RepID=UPI00398B2F43
MSNSPTTRSTRARIAANERWSKVHNRSEATSAARAAFEAKFEREVDPDRCLSPAERAKRVANARAAYFARLALRSATARKARARGGDAA